MDAGESKSEQFEGEEDEEEVESVGRLVREAIVFILPEKEILVGGWALIEGLNNTDQIDSVLVLTKFVFGSLIFFSKRGCYITLFFRTTLIAVSYDDDTKLSDVKHISFDEISSLEYGRLSKSSRIHLRFVRKNNFCRQYQSD